MQWLQRAILQPLLMRLRSKLSMAALHGLFRVIIAGTIRSSARRKSHMLIPPLMNLLHSCAALELALTMAVDLVRILVTTRGTGRSIWLHF